MTAKTKKTPTPTPTPVEPTNFATPGDDTQPKPKRSHPSKGRTYRVLGEGEGDYCIYEITPQGSQLPLGCLVPIPETPRFESTSQAEKWIRGESMDLLMGKQVMIFKAMEIMTIEVLNRPQISITKKPRILVKTPEAEDGAV
ncbi:MAG: hypothetical protein V3R87_02815 [Dehalococcoidia bacterium]